MRRVRTFARTATKSQEKQLISNAKQLFDDPLVLLPSSSSSDCEKYLKKIRKILEKTHRMKDNEGKLEKLSKKRGLDGALAGTLLLAHSEKAPYLAVAKLPHQDVLYAKRGNALKEYLIGLQHFDDPILRLFCFQELASKRLLYMYSWKNGFHCSGRQPEPPNAFVSFILATLNLKCSKGVCSCSHLKNQDVLDKKPAKDHYLRIHWKSAEYLFAICRKCAESSSNTMFSISKYILSPDLSADFDIQVIGQMTQQQDASSTPSEHVEKYLNGSLSDLQLIDATMKQQKDDLQDSDEPLYVLNGHSYGSNMHDFIKALQPTKIEQQGLELLLQRVEDPLIVDDITANKLLERYWKEHGKAIMEEFIDDEDLAGSFYLLDETPATILQLATEYKKRQHIIAKLPSFTDLSPLAGYADTVAKTYKTFGKAKTISTIKKHPDTSKGKSLSYAFLLALDKGADVKWKYSSVEQEYGSFLKDYAHKLLNADPKQYRSALQELLTASGSTEQIK